MYYVFYKTNDVFLAEELLNNSGIPCEVVPTPVTDRAYCGVCIKTEYDDKDGIVLNDLEYITKE